jgi:hypothetical protein
MKYDKPEVLILASAVTAIQSSGPCTGKSGPPQDAEGCTTHSNASAYEADE